MLKLWDKIKLKIFLLTHGLNYSIAFAEQLYRVYLNHNKIIHYRQGMPVYSLSTPALFSEPSANFFTRLLFRVIQNKNTPNLMSFAINDVCDSKCDHCSFFSRVDNKKRKVLTTDQAIQALHDAQDLGVSVINFVGGEPLLRPDLPEIVSSIDKKLSTVILFTNGSQLLDKAQALKDAGVDGVYISIDAADEKKHNLIRHNPGVFQKAIAGIKKVKKLGLSTGISCVVTPESFEKGEFDRIVELAKKIGVHEVLVFDSLPVGRLQKRQDLITKKLWIDKLIAGSKKFNNDPSYPGVLIYAYATSHRGAGCSGGTSYFYLNPYGDVSPCDFNGQYFGNVLEEPLYECWERMTNDHIYHQSTWGGCKVRNPKYKKYCNTRKYKK